MSQLKASETSGNFFLFFSTVSDPILTLSIPYLVIISSIFLVTTWVDIRGRDQVAFPKNAFQIATVIESPIPSNKSIDERINSDIAIGMLTTRSFHGRLAEPLGSWWDVKRFPDLVSVWSDYANQTANTPFIPGLMNSGCEPSYHFGLWCKNAPMIEHWRTNPRFKHTKWFMRIMDDTYVHLENLLHLVDQYDHLDPIIIGDRFCTERGFDYPSGGPGIVISKGALNAWDTKAWFQPQTANRAHDQYFDDVMWGEYLHNARPKVTFIHHHGITQNWFQSHSQIFKYYLKFKDPKLLWPLDYRVVSVHQHRSDLKMAQLHQHLHEIRYEPVAEKVVPIPPCKCSGTQHRRCHYDLSKDPGPCFYENTLLTCISEGPWPHNP